MRETHILDLECWNGILEFGVFQSYLECTLSSVICSDVVTFIKDTRVDRIHAQG